MGNQPIIHGRDSVCGEFRIRSYNSEAIGMYISCLAKTWRVQTRHSLLGVIAVSLSPLVAILALYLAQVCVVVVCMRG